MGIPLKLSIVSGPHHHPGVLTGAEVSKDFSDIAFPVKDMNYAGGGGHLSLDRTHGFNPAIGLLFGKGTLLLGLFGGSSPLFTLLRGFTSRGRHDRRTVPELLPQQPLGLTRFGLDR
jgi:hypothetical protein